MGYLSSISRSISSYLHTSLSLALFKNDNRNCLPRVFFCSIVWIHQSPLKRKENDDDDDDDDFHDKHQSMKNGSKLTNSSTCHVTLVNDNCNNDKHIHDKKVVHFVMNTIDEVVDDNYKCTTTTGATTSSPQNNVFEDIKDHKFTIIKHSNENYQIVQGYITQNSKNKGFGNSDWQKMVDNKYSSCDGFDKESMTTFLTTLGTFVDNKTVFSTIDHYNMFGMRLEESNGCDYWPSLSYSELVDSCIIGCGDRCVANAVEDYIDNYIDE